MLILERKGPIYIQASHKDIPDHNKLNRGVWTKDIFILQGSFIYLFFFFAKQNRVT